MMTQVEETRMFWCEKVINPAGQTVLRMACSGDKKGHRIAVENARYLRAEMGNALAIAAAADSEDRED